MARPTLALFGLVAVGLSAGCEDHQQPSAQPTTPTPAFPPSPDLATKPPPLPVDRGEITGRVLLKGKPPALHPISRASDTRCPSAPAPDETVVVGKDGGLANVLVRMPDVPGDFPPPQTPVVLHQKGCLYSPRVVATLVGQPLEITNDDPTLHNIHGRKGATTIWNVPQLPGAPPIVKKFVDGDQILNLKCDVHPWMTGYVAVTKNPLNAVTGDDGSFTIKDVPVGKWRLEAWHELYGTKPVDVTVEKGKPAKVEIAYDAAEGPKQP